MPYTTRSSARAWAVTLVIRSWTDPRPDSSRSQIGECQLSGTGNLGPLAWMRIGKTSLQHLGDCDILLARTILPWSQFYLVSGNVRIPSSRWKSEYCERNLKSQHIYSCCNRLCGVVSLYILQRDRLSHSQFVTRNAEPTRRPIGVALL